ncbi:MAG: PEGA domain-containing protein [Bradymonadia bacterium]
MNTRQISALVCLLTFLCFAHSNAAEPSKREQARSFFKAGQQALAAEKYGDAIAAFEKANQLSPHPAMLLNIARVYEAVDDLKSAIRYFKAYRKANPKAKDVGPKIAELRARYASWPAVNIASTPDNQVVRITSPSNPPVGKTPLRLKMKPGSVDVLVGEQAPIKKSVRFEQGSTPTIQFQVVANQTVQRLKQVKGSPTDPSLTATLVINADVPGSQVRIDDRLVGITPLPTSLRLQPGVHHLTVIAPDGQTHKEVVNLGNQEKREVLISLNANAGSFSQTEIIGLSSLSAGGIALALGIVSGISALDANTKLKDCRAGECAGTPQEVTYADEVREKAQLTDILIGSGVALSAAGTYLYFTSDRDDDEETKQADTWKYRKADEVRTWSRGK